MKTNWIQRLLNRLGDILTDTGTTIPGTITTMQGNVTDILADTAELQGDWADGGRLDLLIDGIKAVTDALPDAGALNDLADILLDTGTTVPGTITTMQGNVTDILADTDELQGDWADGGRLDLLLDAIKAVTDALPDAGALNDLADIHDTDLPAVKTDTGNLVTRLGTPAAGTVAGDVESVETKVDGLITSKGRMLFTLDCWSAMKEEVLIDAAGATTGLPTITVGELPDGATIVKAVLMFKFRMIENFYEGVNNLNGATVAGTSQVFQIQDDGGGDWKDGIPLVDNLFTLASLTREGGDILIGLSDVSGTGFVDGNDIYNTRLLLGKADFDDIRFNDVQVGLRIWYSV